MTEGEQEALKPCPFCGSAAALRPWGKGPVECWFVGCENEGCYLCRPRAIHGTEEQAIVLWNTRAHISATLNEVDVGVAEDALAAVWDRDTSAKDAAIICAEAWGLLPGQAKDDSEVAWLIIYEDAERENELFVGTGAKDAALRRFEQISWQWNATLLRQYKQNFPNK